MPAERTNKIPTSDQLQVLFLRHIKDQVLLGQCETQNCFKCTVYKIGKPQHCSKRSEILTQLMA